MKAGRRCETPGSEIKNLILFRTTEDRESAFSLVLQDPNPTEICNETPARSWGRLQKRNSKFRIPESF